MHWLLAVGLALFAPFAAAQEDGEEQASTPNPGAGKGPGGRNMPDFKAMQAQAKKMRDQQLEQLKKVNPKLYELQKENMERTDKIQEIVTRWRKSELTEGEARKELTPLIKEQVQPELAGIDGRVEAMEKQLEFLKQVQKKPHLLVERRIDELLIDVKGGKRGPGGMPPNLMMPGPGGFPGPGGPPMMPGSEN